MNDIDTLLFGGAPRSTDRVTLRLARTITFRNGNVLLFYTPEGQ
jgi:hypothetical protein